MKIRSLRLRLIIALSLLSLIFWTISGVLVWLRASEEVNELFDAQQILFAQRLASSNLHELLNASEPRKRLIQRQKRKYRKINIEDDALAFAVFSRDGNLLLSDGRNGDDFYFVNKRGFSIDRIKDDDEKWRIFWLPSANGKLMIAVGQEVDYRQSLIRKIVFAQLWVWLLALPLLLILITWVIHQELKSLRKVGRALSERKPEDQSKLKTNDVPSEVLPLVDSLNNFFERTSRQLLRERRFTSDAAHELRSPLTALSVQVQVAQMSGQNPSVREQALQNLTLGIHRASQLIDQLLVLSRLDSVKELEEIEHIAWEKLIRSLIGEMYAQAQKSQIELRYIEQGRPDNVNGQSMLLSLMLRNLIDNAIKYSKPSSVVELVLNRDSLVVRDNGGGLPLHEFDKLGQRFYRAAGQNEKGSGLGLSIVKRIAELHHFNVAFHPVFQGQDIIGFEAEIRFA
ncbi:quorum sensing histidine kinase QseC [Basilea psittacipulmonis]|nr:quorum sensing histidine kinase QseC [Basilea psittacipulmonis]